MIQNKNKSIKFPSGTKEACTGCVACAAICPTKCISMKSDDEGFLRPIINVELCNDCGLCQLTCPVNLDNVEFKKFNNFNEPLAVYAAWHMDPCIRKESSSGGVFTALAENIFKKGGVVVGAAFDKNMILKHTIIESRDDIQRLRGSKYIQSDVSIDLLERVKNMLKQDKYVLFTGTPCQISGLQSYLKKEYINLICCDLICHGVASPKLFDLYLKHLKSYGKNIINISFRNKENGWKNFRMRYNYKNGEFETANINEDPYMISYMKEIALRECCYICQFAKIKRVGDISLGDYWGVAEKYPDYDKNDLGTSLILINNLKGSNSLKECTDYLFYSQTDICSAIKGNPMLIKPCIISKRRKSFYKDLNNLEFIKVIKIYRLYKKNILMKYFINIVMLIKSKFKKRD